MWSNQFFSYAERFAYGAVYGAPHRAGIRLKKRRQLTLAKLVEYCGQNLIAPRPLAKSGTGSLFRSVAATSRWKISTKRLKLPSIETIPIIAVKYTHDVSPADTFDGRVRGS